MQKKGVAMKYLTVIALALFAISQNSYGGGEKKLDYLILENVKSSVKSYDRVLDVAQKSEAPRLWVHVRSKTQENAVKDVSAWLKSIMVDGKTIDLRPTQLVTSGPAENELRFFKKQDASQVQKLFNELKKILPELRLKDLSPQYEGISSIKPGHYELWLAPSVSSLKVP